MNAVRCLICGDIIMSTFRWDFKWCECGNIAVDGGDDYKRRSGKALGDNSYKEIDTDEELLNEQAHKIEELHNDV